MFQLYPENLNQRELILNAAMHAGFAGGIVVDFPHRYVRFQLKYQGIICLVKRISSKRLCAVFSVWSANQHFLFFIPVSGEVFIFLVNEN